MLFELQTKEWYFIISCGIAYALTLEFSLKKILIRNVFMFNFFSLFLILIFVWEWNKKSKELILHYFSFEFFNEFTKIKNFTSDQFSMFLCVFEMSQQKCWEIHVKMLEIYDFVFLLELGDTKLIFCFAAPMKKNKVARERKKKTSRNSLFWLPRIENTHEFFCVFSMF